MSGCDEYVRKLLNFPLFSDLNLTEYGWRSGYNGHKYEALRKQCYYFTLFREGTGTVHSRNNSYPLLPGTLVVMFANNENIYYEANPGAHYSASWIGVYGSTLPYYLSKLGITEERPFLKLANMHVVEMAMEEILAMEESDTISASMAYMSRLYHFFDALFDELSTFDKKGYVEQGMEYMSSMFSTGITSSDVAKFVGIDRSYFSMLFKRITGTTPTEHLKHLRIKRAIVLLTNTELSIDEVSLAVGIQDEAYFSRIFSKIVGISPAQYRKHHTNQ